MKANGCRYRLVVRVVLTNASTAICAWLGDWPLWSVLWPYWFERIIATFYAAASLGDRARSASQEQPLLLNHIPALLAYLVLLTWLSMPWPESPSAGLPAPDAIDALLVAASVSLSWLFLHRAYAEQRNDVAAEPEHKALDLQPKILPMHVALIAGFYLGPSRNATVVFLVLMAVVDVLLIHRKRERRGLFARIASR